jgi:DNA-binding MarR family transcriptional regulator
VKDIGGELRLDPATLSPLLKRLEALGYLTRHRSTTDERMLDVELTRAGRALRRKAEKIPYAVVERLGMDVDDLMKLHRALSEVIAATQ